MEGFPDDCQKQRPKTKKRVTPRGLYSLQCLGAAVVCAGLVCGGTAGWARAEEPSVPLKLQAELLGKVVTYDRNAAGRAGDKHRILIVINAADADSKNAASEIERYFRRLATIGELPHQESVTVFKSAAALVSEIKAQRTTLVYLTPGLSSEAASIAHALVGSSVLSVSAISRDVTNGIVLGFDLVSGKPKLWINLTQARQQGVDFQAQFLRLAKVVQ